MFRTHTFIYLFASLVFCSVARGQTYFTNGNAKPLNADCYQLTEAVNWQLSSVWYADKLDLNNNFDLEFELYFGTRDLGADGIVFVLQTAGNKALGTSGGGLGFEGFSPSLGIEFDTWNNTDQGDLGSDHLAILKNGNVDHNSIDAVTAPVPLAGVSGNIEDGAYHDVRISWNASANLLEIWFDCVLKESVVIDLINSTFNGENQVFWGFTSSTGGENNIQQVCVRENILRPDTTLICETESLILNAGKSKLGDYSWNPDLYLDDNGLQNPTSTPSESITYTVSYTDICGDFQSDTIHVGLNKKPDLGELDDVSLCSDEDFSLAINNVYGTITLNDSTELQQDNLTDYEGRLKVVSKNICGIDSAEIEVARKYCGCDMWYPNIFTPNNDGLNEDFGPVDICNNVSDYCLKIYNRWGESVFETSDVNGTWNGALLNKKIIEGTYFWVASWTVQSKNARNEELQNGIVEIIK